MLLSTDNVVIARFAGALYNMVLDYRTDNEVLAATATFGVSPFLNAIYTRDFSNTTTTNVANIIATNLGLTGDAATQAKQYIVGVLNGTAPEQRGAAIGNMLNLFAQMTTDATFGPAALAWEALVVNAVAYSQDPTSLKVLTNINQAPVTNTATGQTFTLTTAIDTLTGTTGNDTFVGTKINDPNIFGSSTLNPGDSIDGSGGTDTLKIIVSNGGATSAAVADLLAGVSLNSVENLTVQNAGTFGVTANLASAPAVSTVTAVNTLATVTFSNLATGAKVVASGAASTANTLFAMKTATDAVSVGVDNGINATGVVATAGTATAATISSTGAANGFGAAGPDGFKLTAGAQTVKTLAVNADTNLKAVLVGSDYVATGAALAVSGGAAKVDLGSFGVFKTIDASGLTAGGLTIDTTGSGANVVTSIVGGAGNDVVTLGVAPSSSATVNLGAGNDTLKGTVGLPSAAVVDGGAGTDYISAALVNVGSAANVKNFEGLDVTGYNSPLDAALLTNSTIANVQFSGAAAGTGNTATIQNLAAAATINVTGAIDQAAVQTNNLGSVTVTQTGTPTLAVSFAAAPGIAGGAPSPGGYFSSLGTVKETGNTAITIASGGDSYVVGNGINALNDTNNKLTTVTITGDHAFTLGSVTTNSAGTAVAGGKVTSSLTTIDGSAATGKLNITAGADTVDAGGNTVSYTGLSISAGSAADSITMQAKNGVVTAGAGNDTITVSANAATSDVVTVNAGAGADTLVSSLAYGQVASASSSATNGDLVFFADAASTDIIKFANVANATGALGAKANVSSASTFDQAVFLADNGAAANTVTWFQYAGNTYIENVKTAVDTADNIVIKLTGLVDLSGAAVVTGANGTLTLA